MLYEIIMEEHTCEQPLQYEVIFLAKSVLATWRATGELRKIVNLQVRFIFALLQLFVNGIHLFKNGKLTSNKYAKFLCEFYS
jgi:hypothetical protein